MERLLISQETFHEFTIREDISGQPDFEYVYHCIQIARNLNLFGVYYGSDSTHWEGVVFFEQGVPPELLGEFKLLGDVRAAVMERLFFVGLELDPAKFCNTRKIRTL